MAMVLFSVGIPVAYKVKTLDIPAQHHDIEVILENGDHVFTSPDIQLGTVLGLGSRPLIGRVSFRYIFDEGSKSVTVCGPKYRSVDGMKLTTTAQGLEQHTCTEYASGAGFADDRLDRNSPWNYRGQLTPGAAEHLQRIVREALDALIESLKAVPGLTIRIRQPLPQLSSQLYHDLCSVERNGKTLGRFDPAQEYEPGDIVHAVDSIFHGLQVWPQNGNFSNVQRSSRDPIHTYHSWMRLWIECFGQFTNHCTSLGMGAGVPWQCSAAGIAPHGGHVIPGTQSMPMAQGSDVYIMPICPRHNNWHNDARYGTCITNVESVWVLYYE